MFLYLINTTLYFKKNVILGLELSWANSTTNNHVSYPRFPMFNTVLLRICCALRLHR